MDDGQWCGGCEFFVPLGKKDATRVCESMPEQGRWLRYRKDVLMSMAAALKRCGICAWRCEIVESIGIPCDEFYPSGN